jgi:teichuronic acid biosynthesis glycosyltransferase TuaC
MISTEKPLRIMVYSSLFPNSVNKNAGVFIKERMFRLGMKIPIVVVAPQAWSPFDGILRKFWPGYRELSAEYEVLEGVEIYRPKVFSVPKYFKNLDGWFMARGSRTVVDRLYKTFSPTIIDAHFGYPDGYAASQLAAKYNLPLTITLRGSKDLRIMGTPEQTLLKKGLGSASAVICVSKELRDNVALKLEVNPHKIRLIGNGVDTDKYSRKDRTSARTTLGLDQGAKIILSVGNLIELKGFSRTIALLPALIQEYPSLLLLIVGGEVPGDNTLTKLKEQVSDLKLTNHVLFFGRIPPQNLPIFYSAADLFVLATRYEGWANVFLEAMACGLPVVSTRVGGNPEVISNSQVGTLVEFWNEEAALEAVRLALAKNWDQQAIINYAQSNSWAQRLVQLEETFRQIVGDCGHARAP